MSLSWGVLCAFIALIGWGLGDFFIQRGMRLAGFYQTLFIITAASTPILLPFVYGDLIHLSASNLYALFTLSIIIFLYAKVLFSAFEEGKISVVEAVIGVELPLTVALGVFLGGERMSLVQFLLFMVISSGLLLAVTTHFGALRKKARLFEKGVALALLGAVLSALTNFYVGTNAQTISPLMTIWFTHAVIAVICLCALFYRGELRALPRNIKKHPLPLLSLCLFDNAAWIGFAFATTLIPISLAVTISESYIALAALLGYFINREKLRAHQFAGASLAIVGVIALASTL